MISVAPKCSNFYEMPSITFVMGGEHYTLEATDYVLTITGTNQLLFKKTLELNLLTSTLLKKTLSHVPVLFSL